MLENVQQKVESIKSTTEKASASIEKLLAAMSIDQKSQEEGLTIIIKKQTDKALTKADNVLKAVSDSRASIEQSLLTLKDLQEQHYNSTIKYSGTVHSDVKENIDLTQTLKNETVRLVDLIQDHPLYPSSLSTQRTLQDEFGQFRDCAVQFPDMAVDAGLETANAPMQYSHENSLRPLRDCSNKHSILTTAGR